MEITYEDNVPIRRILVKQKVTPRIFRKQVSLNTWGAGIDLSIRSSTSLSVSAILDTHLGLSLDMETATELRDALTLLIKQGVKEK